MTDSSFSREFSQRKSDHLRVALDPRTQADGLSQLDQITLQHEALPDFNFQEVDLSTSFFASNLSSPLFISSMTAGHDKGLQINSALARLSARRKILMGVGSQRRELIDDQAALEWQQVRAQAQGAFLLGNLGIAQVIQTPLVKIQNLIDSVQALGLFVHLNPLQECIQPEGTPQFKDSLKAVAHLAKNLQVPVIVKETGCGFSVDTLKRLSETGVHAVDISGLGGTHWGRIEGYRSEKNELLYKVAETFSNWGISTTQTMLNALEVQARRPHAFQIWASGGIRTGLDATKMCAMGAQMVGLAKPFLEAAILPEADLADRALEEKLDQLELEMKIAFFCTGVRTLSDFKTKKVWQWQNR